MKNVLVVDRNVWQCVKAWATSLAKCVQELQSSENKKADLGLVIVLYLDTVSEIWKKHDALTTSLLQRVTQFRGHTLSFSWSMIPFNNLPWIHQIRLHYWNIVMLCHLHWRHWTNRWLMLIFWKGKETSWF